MCRNINSQSLYTHTHTLTDGHTLTLAPKGRVEFTGYFIDDANHSVCVTVSCLHALHKGLFSHWLELTWPHWGQRRKVTRGYTETKQAENDGNNILYNHKEQDIFNIVVKRMEQLLRKVEFRPLVATQLTRTWRIKNCAVSFLATCQPKGSAAQ